MTENPSLFLYQELLLLGLRDDRGTLSMQHSGFALAGAVLAELLLNERIAVADDRRQTVSLVDATSLGDPVIDDSLQQIAAGRRISLRNWVTRIARTRQMRDRAAGTLRDKGILRLEQDRLLGLFPRRLYLQTDPSVKQAIIARLREAIFSGGRRLEPRTVILVSLARGAGLLNRLFGRRPVHTHRGRIEQIASGELVGETTRSVIAACQTAIIVAAVVPTISAGSS